MKRGMAKRPPDIAPSRWMHSSPCARCDVKKKREKSARASPQLVRHVRARNRARCWLHYSMVHTLLLDRRKRHDASVHWYDGLDGAR